MGVAPACGSGGGRVVGCADSPRPSGRWRRPDGRGFPDPYGLEPTIVGMIVVPVFLTR